MAGSSLPALLRLVYATHRPETVGLFAEIIAVDEVVILEEPPHPDFAAMLTDHVELEEYLLANDLEYLEFSLAQCRLMQRMHAAGKEIFQVEPFFERLLTVQQFFADDHAPAELDPYSPLYSVYHCEREATGALLSYYQAARLGNFPVILQALAAFARADAARFRLRDTLRCEQILAVLRPGKNTAVEAGPIHLLLERLLRQRLPAGWSLRSHFVDNEALRRLTLRGSLYSPGDELTLGYLLENGLSTERERLLCAQSLIYAKIVAKEEISPGDCLFPHTRNEYTTIRLVRQLSLDDCRTLFFRIRPLPTAEACAAVEDFLRRGKRVIYTPSIARGE